jgi:hypothetical protein
MDSHFDRDETRHNNTCYAGILWNYISIKVEHVERIRVLIGLLLYFLYYTCTHSQLLLLSQFISLFPGIELVNEQNQMMQGPNKMKILRDSRRDAMISASELILTYESSEEREKEIMEEDVNKARQVISEEQERKMKKSISDKRSSNKRKSPQCITIDCFVIPTSILDLSSPNSIYRELASQLPLKEAGHRRSLLQPFGQATGSFFVAGTIYPVVATVEDGSRETPKQTSHDKLTNYLKVNLGSFIAFMQHKQRKHVFVDYIVVARVESNASHTILCNDYDVSEDENLSHSEMPFSCIFTVKDSFHIRLLLDEENNELPQTEIQLQWCLKLAALASHACGPNAHLCEQYRIQLKFSTKKKFFHPRS